jgi:putative tryptophan/tyrosine transport system substrate-binding protein
MDRRRFLLTSLAGVLAAPLAAEAQGPPRVPRIGYLTASLVTPFHAGFREGLRQAGYIEGQNILVEYRVYEGLADRAAELAADLIRSNVDLIVVASRQQGRPGYYSVRSCSLCARSRSSRRRPR